MTAVLALQQEQGWIIASDGEMFSEEHRYIEKNVGKMWREKVLATSKGRLGEAVIAHAGTSRIGQVLKHCGLPKSNITEYYYDKWEPTDEYLWRVVEHWRAVLDERNLMIDNPQDEETHASIDGGSDILIGITNRKGSVTRLWTVDAMLTFAEPAEPYAVIGCAGSLLQGAAAVLLERSEDAQTIIDAAFSVARRHFAHVGERVYLERLGGE